MSGEDEPFDISEFIDSQKWILASMGVFAAIGIQLQNWPGEDARDIISIGVVASIFLFGFMSYLFTKNLQDEFGGVWGTIEFLLSFQLASIELVVFLTLFYLLVGVVISFSPQFTVGIITLLKIALFIAGIGIFNLGVVIGSRITRSGGLWVGVFLAYVALAVTEGYDFHLLAGEIDMILYLIQSTSTDVYLIAISAGVLVFPALLVFNSLLYPLEVLRSIIQD